MHTCSNVAMHMYVCVSIQNKWAPLHIAVKHGHASVIESLVKLGVDVNARSTVSYTVAFCTCAYKCN